MPDTTQIPTEMRMDALGNQLDPSVSYARGPILRGVADEVRRMTRGRELIRTRSQEWGLDRLYNLTGVTRAFPISEDDRMKLSTQISFYAHFGGTAEAVGIRYAGGAVDRHAACFANQVTSAMLATMLTLAGPGQKVLSIVPGGHSHPCIRNSTRIAGAEFAEVIGRDRGFKELQEWRPDIVVITTVTPQKFVFQEGELRQQIKLANDIGCRVVVDDAHGALRMGYYGQAPVLTLGTVDISMNSMDKHLRGPRAALVVGEKKIVELVRDQILELGLTAQFSAYVASLRALQGYDPEEIKAAGKLAEELMPRLRMALDTKLLYSAGPGLALSEIDLTSIVMRRAGRKSLPIVPMEVSALISMRALDTAGLMTILTIGMPGASPTFRLMMFPDGALAGVDRIVAAVDEAVTYVAKHALDVEFCERYLYGI